MYKFIVQIIILIGSISCSGSRAENKIFVTVHTKQKTFVVTLPSNATTGFQWQIMSYDSKILTLIEDKYIQPKNGRIGQAGLTSFTWKLKPRTKYPPITYIKMQYARPWETTVDFKITKTIAVKII